MRIEITTEGGFTGRGIGSVSVDASTNAEVAHAAGDARPSTWRDEYSARGGDLVRYTLTIDGQSVSWDEGAAIPRDLEELFEVVWACR